MDNCRTRTKSNVVYLVAVTALILTGFIFGPTKNPYGKDFFRLIIPGLLLLNSLQWIPLSFKLRWRTLGILGSLLVGLLFALAYVRVDFATFTTILILGMFAHGSVLWFLASGRTEKSVILAQHIAVVFVVLVGLDLNRRGIASHIGESSLATAGFLFWSPLFALVLWPGGVVYKRDKEGQVLLVCAIFQVGIGLFDLGAMWNVPWGFPCAFVTCFAALGLAAYLAKTWQSRTSSSYGSDS
jgi:hypothetical protein